MSDDQNPNPNKEKPSFYSDTRKTIRILIVTLSFIGAFAWANLSLNTFTSGTTISSNQMNANFTAIEEAISSNIILKNPAVFSVTDTSNCAERRVIKFDGSGSEVANYNVGTGIFSFADDGLYQLSYLLECSTCNKNSIYLCSDADQTAPDTCEDASKPNYLYLGDLNTYTNSGAKFVKIEAGKSYKLMISFSSPCNNTVNIADAEASQIYIKKMR